MSDRFVGLALKGLISDYLENIGASSLNICDALRDLIAFVQFGKREKHPWRSVTLNTKSNTPPWVFFSFFKLYKWYQIVQRTIYQPFLNGREQFRKAEVK